MSIDLLVTATHRHTDTDTHSHTHRSHLDGYVLTCLFVTFSTRFSNLDSNVREAERDVCVGEGKVDVCGSIRDTQAKYGGFINNECKSTGAKRVLSTLTHSAITAPPDD